MLSQNPINLGQSKRASLFASLVASLSSSRSKLLFVCCDLPRKQTCWSSLQLSSHLNLHGSLQTLLRPNLLVREIHRDRCNRSRSPSRSTNCHHATLAAVDKLDYEHCRDRTYSIVFAIKVIVRNLHRDRTSSFVLSQLDSEVVGYVTVRRASDRP